MDTPKQKQELEDVLAFQRSISRPIKSVAWQYPKMREPAAHVAWRGWASILTRMRLYAKASLPVDSALASLYLDTLAHERAAWSAWRKRKQQMEAELLTGKRKSLPWSC
jgi:hypothetical protein